MFVCFKWKRIASGFQLPAVCDYSARHVNVLRNMLERHISVPHRLLCVTDDAQGIDPRVEIIPLWDKCRQLGGCYNRLWVFSREAKTLFGERFVCIDLDCVFTADCTTLFDRPEPFVINAYNPAANDKKDQHYNGSMMLLMSGARASVWDAFDPGRSPGKVKDCVDTVGTDQAWIRMHLGKGEARWTNADGVFEARQIKSNLTKDVRLVFFSGKRDPSKFPYGWIARHWR